MSTTQIPPGPAGPAGADPGHYYPGPYYPGPGGPGGPGYGGGGGGGSRRPRGLALAIVAVVAALFGAGLTSAVLAGNGSTPRTVLSTSQITNRVSPALVDINTTLGYQHARAAGTGIVLTSSGEVLTNNHVIEGATSISATDIGNGRTYQAKVVGYDQRDDVAVLRLRGASGLRTAILGDSSSTRTGQKVVAMGNAGGRGGAPSVVTGRVTGLHRAINATDEGAATSERLTGLIRTNARIQPGDSGGPLINTYGQVIGMNTAASSGFRLQDQGQSATTAFAIPAATAGSIADQIDAGNSANGVHLGPTAFLGVGLVPANQAAPGLGTGSTGAAISQVVTGSPAARAGLAAGDQIVSLGGHQVRSPSDVQDTMTKYHPGDRVSVSWHDQAGQSHAATVTLAAGPAG